MSLTDAELDPGTDTAPRAGRSAVGADVSYSLPHERREKGVRNRCTKCTNCTEDRLGPGGTPARGHAMSYCDRTAHGAAATTVPRGRNGGSNRAWGRFLDAHNHPTTPTPRI